MMLLSRALDFRDRVVRFSVGSDVLIDRFMVELFLHFLCLLLFFEMMPVCMILWGFQAQKVHESRSYRIMYMF
jgi:hypothetical protein